MINKKTKTKQILRIILYYAVYIHYNNIAYTIYLCIKKKQIDN